MKDNYSREIDALVATEVMGWRKVQHRIFGDQWEGWKWETGEWGHCNFWCPSDAKLGWTQTLGIVWPTLSDGEKAATYHCLLDGVVSGLKKIVHHHMGQPYGTVRYFDFFSYPPLQICEAILTAKNIKLPPEGEEIPCGECRHFRCRMDGLDTPPECMESLLCHGGSKFESKVPPKRSFPGLKEEDTCQCYKKKTP